MDEAGEGARVELAETCFNGAGSITSRTVEYSSQSSPEGCPALQWGRLNHEPDGDSLTDFEKAGVDAVVKHLTANNLRTFWARSDPA